MQHEKDENPEPFDIIKNARNKGKKAGPKTRKASYHNPPTIKKTRKMTANLEN